MRLQGNVFTRICRSVHRGGGSPSGQTPLPWTETRIEQTETPRERDVPELTSSGGHRSGWYISYWNACILVFLNFFFMLKNSTTRMQFIWSNVAWYKRAVRVLRTLQRNALNNNGRYYRKIGHVTYKQT